MGWYPSGYPRVCTYRVTHGLVYHYSVPMMYILNVTHGFVQASYGDVTHTACMLTYTMYIMMTHGDVQDHGNQATLDGFGRTLDTLGQPWTTLDGFGQLWTDLGQPLTALDNLGRPWTASYNLGRPWTALDNLGRLCMAGLCNQALDLCNQALDLCNQALRLGMYQRCSFGYVPTLFVWVTNQFVWVPKLLGCLTNEAAGLGSASLYNKGVHCVTKHFISATERFIRITKKEMHGNKYTHSQKYMNVHGLRVTKLKNKKYRGHAGGHPAHAQARAFVPARVPIEL